MITLNQHFAPEKSRDTVPLKKNRNEVVGTVMQLLGLLDSKAFRSCVLWLLSYATSSRPAGRLISLQILGRLLTDGPVLTPHQEQVEPTGYCVSRLYRVIHLEGHNYSVADPGCLSRIPDPDFYPSRIPDLGSRIPKQQQKRGLKNFFLVIPFYLATNFTKIEHYFSFEKLKKKIWVNFQRIV